MSEIKDWLPEIFEYWPTWRGLALAEVIALLLSIAFLQTTNIINNGYAKSATIALILVGLFFVWWRTHIPRVAKGKVGFGVAIEFENDAEAKILRADLFRTLRTLLDSPKQKEIQFIEIPQSWCKRMQSESEVRRLQRLSGISFLLFGYLRLRTQEKVPTYVLDLRAGIRHVPLNEIAQQRFQREFSKVLPSRLLVEKDDTLFKFDIHAHEIDAVASFTLGTAVAFTGNFDYSEQLLRTAEERCRQHEQASTTLRQLLALVHARLRELYALWLNTCYTRYAIKKDRSALVKAEELIKKLRTYDPENYHAKLVAAIAAFELHRDIGEARREIARCKSNPDSTWMYSDAFLQAYEGDLDGAYRTYTRAFSLPLDDPTIPIQCETFIEEVLRKEPDRSWLHFCLGLINQEAKRDKDAAKRDFESFIEKADSATFQMQIRVAEKRIREIEGRVPLLSENTTGAVTTTGTQVRAKLATKARKRRKRGKRKR